MIDMKKAEIVGGKVVNVILVDPASIPDWCANWPTSPNDVSIGWSYAGGQFSPPAPVIPTRREQEAARHAAYVAEADPIFFMAQRNEATMEEWAAKVADIKLRYPYPLE